MNRRADTPFIFECEWQGTIAARGMMGITMHATQAVSYKSRFVAWVRKKRPTQRIDLCFTCGTLASTQANVTVNRRLPHV
ncbi:hypothetical protein TKWG_15615 [Advenella kashmirensis WT001]|uniref:Uncharacterized protein n=1 Tax=Advenella kashmirensis (strain DSM 17095 / LMG 22695 / WT001) TaxID=1036672 RepID=I3UDM6_ADVKW|nr:hypothetical protein TKWG_15615 [Advenella kashmirensis WT001]